MARKKELSTKNRRTQIITAADLVLLEVGVERFTIDQVIAKANIAKGTVYNYYRNKDEILGVLGAKALDMLHTSFAENSDKHSNSLEKIRAICFACYDYHKEFPQYFELISYMERPEFEIGDESYLKISSRLSDLMVNIVGEGQSEGEISAKFDPMAINYIMWASCVGVVQFLETKKKMLNQFHEIDTKMLIDTYTQMITQGLAP